MSAFAKRHRASSAEDAETWGDAEVAPAVTGWDMTRAPAQAPVLAYTGSPRDGYKPDDAAPTLLKDGSHHGGTRNMGETLIAPPADPTVLDTYNQDEVEGGVTNTLAKSPTTALMGAGDTDGPAVDLNPKPDGRRYAACGDGVAAPQATWIALRLRAVIDGRDPDA